MNCKDIDPRSEEMRIRVARGGHLCFARAELFEYSTRYIFLSLISFFLLPAFQGKSIVKMCTFIKYESIKPASQLFILLSVAKLGQYTEICSAPIV